MIEGTAVRQERPRPLSIGHFRRIAENGFGDGRNSYPFCSVWVNGCLYIGTNREAIPILVLRSPFKLPFVYPPVPTPEPDKWHELDLRAQIWRYNPEKDKWKRVFNAPKIPGHGGLMVPLAVGFRCMAVFQGRSDPKPTIYTIPVVGRNAFNTTVLRCVDGENFESLGPPKIGGRIDEFAAYRAMTAFKGYLFAAPSAGKPPPTPNAGKDGFVSLLNTAQNSAVRCSDDPVQGVWQLSSEIGFGDNTNISILDMAVCGDYLYAGTLNAIEGFQLWRTDAEGLPPHRWEKILDHGADRGPLNEGVLSMAAFNGVLYVGTCIQNGGYDRAHNIGPAAAEVLRVFPDGRWDLVMGAPRITRQGLKAPTSGLGPGFQNPFNVYMWRMCAHDGALYVGTHDLSSFFPFIDKTTWPDRVNKLFEQVDLDTFMKYKGGCELWRTVDGDSWTPVTVNGFDNFYNFGFRALVSSPKGLFVGAANPFGPLVAKPGPNGWHYENNPRGGVEIWHGSVKGVSALPEISSNFDPEKYLAENLSVPMDAQNIQLDELSAGIGLVADTEFVEHSLNDPIDEFWNVCKSDPLFGMAFSDMDHELDSASVEENVNGYFGNSPVHCVGYWTEETFGPEFAIKNLIGQFLQLLQKTRENSKDILLIGQYSHQLVDEIYCNFPLADCKFFTGKKFGGHTTGKFRSYARRLFKLLNWRIESTDYADCCFDALLWIEGPEASGLPGAFQEAYRILRPGGILLASSLLCNRQPDLEEASGLPGDGRWLNEFRHQLEDCCGFKDVTVTDLTEISWSRFFQHSRMYAYTKGSFLQMEDDHLTMFLDALPGGRHAIEAYLILTATK